MRVGWLGAFAAVAACDFTPGGDGDVIDARFDADPTLPDGVVDADPNDPVIHLGPSDEAMLAGTADAVFDGQAIDTDALTITPALPVELVVFSAMQDAGGPEVMVIQGANLTFTGNVDAHGSRALLFVATGTITVSAWIDVSADYTVAGAGGYGAGLGDGAGFDGMSVTKDDGGGAGGSFGSNGGIGGDGGNAVGGAPRTTYGDWTRLEGGSGGGNGVPCNASGGAGGGALQLTAGVSITIAGGLHAGGGGSDPGTDCGSSNGASGGGGGAGGMIFLQSPLLLGAGDVRALGGGGAGGASDSGGNPGIRGLDAQWQEANGGSGGNGGLSEGGGGGGGASGGAGGNNGGQPSIGGIGGDGGDRSGNQRNGGGGGGGVGRIFYVTTGALPSYTDDPDGGAP
jgi:hypothetical protein